jgi:glycosyltransferase involved in cell wall biosynthesis
MAALAMPNRRSAEPEPAPDPAGPVVPSRGERLRVLVICYEFPPAGGGGGRVAATVASGLARRGHAVRVLTSHVKGLARQETSDGGSVRRAFAGRRALDRCTVPEMAAYVLAHAAPAASELARFRPDVVHAHFAVPSGAVAWLATRIARVPYVLTAHLGDVPGGAPEQTDRLFRVVKPFTAPIWRGASATTAVASHVAALAEAAYGVRPQVIPNGVPMAGRPVVRSRPATEPVRAIWIGRIQKQKNLASGIASLAPLAGRAWMLDVVGDGPLRANAEAEAVRAGLSGQVRFHGWLPAEKVNEALAAADLLFLPSLNEGLSLVTVEALRAGLAFVASRIAGVSDVVDEENGILCDLARPESFATALGMLVGDRKRLFRLREASAARAPLFDAERMIEAYEAVLCSVARAARAQ